MPFAIFLFTSPSISLCLCPDIPLCFIHPMAVFESCGVPWSCWDGGSCNFVPVSSPNVGSPQEGDLHVVKWGLFWSESILEGCEAGPKDFWLDSIWWQVPLMLVHMRHPYWCILNAHPSPSGSLVKKEAHLLCREEQTVSWLIHHCLCQVQAVDECSETDTALGRTYIKCSLSLLARNFWLGRK